jgi:hypothetical protein
MEESSPQITFYIPSALEVVPSRATSQHSCLEMLIARGDTAQTELNGDQHLLALFGGDPSGPAARAAVSHLAQYEGSDAAQWRIIASPVHLLADHATLHFPPQPDPLLNDEESRALMASCQDHFAEEGWQLECGDANSWYLHVNGASSITTTPVNEAVGKPLFEALPQGDDARIWRRWTNEVQMLFHTHAVNDARQARGNKPINSLWFWGEGCLPGVTPGSFSQVFGGDRYVQGLAKLSGAQWAPLPSEFAEISESGQHGAILVALDAATGSCWESEWFCPLRNTLRDRSVSSVVFHFHNGYTTQLKPSMLLRFWRRKHLSIAMAESAS